MNGNLRAIWVKRAKRGPMDPALAGVLVAGRGLAGNAHQGGRRQVILIEEERWTEALADLGSRLPCRLRIWTECLPCHQMDEACSGLQAALRPDWRGGACAEVLEGGTITLGDAVEWESTAAEP